MATQLSPRQRRLIRELCRGYRRWAPKDERVRPRPVDLLGGGYSNVTVRLSGGRGSYVLRLSDGIAPPGVDRQREARLLRLAAARGIAVRPLYCDARRQLLITPLHRCRPEDPVQIPALAYLLRRIHELPAIGSPMDSSRQLQRLVAELPAADPCVRLLNGSAASLGEAGNACRRTGARHTTCHNDLLAANRCLSEERLLALDWEYAAPGDPYFDLAVCASELPQGRHETLLAAYLGRLPAAAEQRHFDAQQLIYCAIEACWWRLYGGDPTRSASCLHRLRHRLRSW